jgi:MutS domain V
MKAFLLYQDRDLLPAHEPTEAEQALTQDLELGPLWAAMAAGDGFLASVAQRAVLASLTSPEAITYRQQILADAVARPAVIRQLYDLAGAAVTGEKKVYFGLMSNSPESQLFRAVKVLELFRGLLKQLRAVADDHGASFQSPGFRRFFAMIAEELDDAYLQTVDDHLKQLGFGAGTLISAGLGRGLKGTGYVLRKPPPAGWWERWSLGGKAGFSFTVADRDEAGQAALSDLRSRGLNGVASALTQACEHILAFFTMLRAELAFYLGALNLREALAAAGEPVCVPVPVEQAKLALTARGLYDPALSLRLAGGAAGRAVGNDLEADGKRLVMITGANQGGKSTFLRSVGLAQLMMQCGLFVAAESFTASVSPGTFTHFNREEDAAMEQGKLDEELSRMRDIAGQLTPGCVLLANESFAATNEQEGSEIGRQIVRALLDSGVRVFFVTHLFDLAQSLYASCDSTALFLRPERRDDGARTFRLRPGEPLSTSYGPDLYRRIFADQGAACGPEIT